jgi:hypothetical protein
MDGKPIPQNAEIVEAVLNLLSRPYPKGNSIGSKVEVGLWMVSIEYLESRLILANVMTKGKWMNGPKVAGLYSQIGPGADTSNGTITTTDVTQARILVEQYVINYASRPYSEIEHFPLRELLERLLRFKASLSREPAFKLLFHTAADAIKEKTEKDMLSLSSVPNESSKRRAWYKYHGLYSALMGLLVIDSSALRKMPFESSWIQDDETLLVMFFAYAINSGQAKRRLPKILLQSKRVSEGTPSLKPVHKAMLAFIA